MKNAWLYFLPVLYMPNLFGGGKTAFGTLEISDFLIFPYIGLTYLANRQHTPVEAHQLQKWGMAFIAWTGLGALSIAFLYNYGNPSPKVIFSLLKVAKFTLYSFAGIRTAKLLSNDRTLKGFHWSLLACGLVISISLVIRQSGGRLAEQESQIYKAQNLISVVMAIFISYLGNLYLNHYGSPVWRRAARVGLGVMLLGFAFSQGRGGWLAAIVAFFFMIFKRGIKLTYVIAIAMIMFGLVSLYEMSPAFKIEVDRTFSWGVYAGGYVAQAVSVNEGHRLDTWAHEAQKFVNSPIMGTGLFHRAGQSGLFSTGSHNFWLQMFLETGAVGGILIFIIMFQMWKQFSPKKIDWHYALPLQSALIATFVGGLSGEYFYGGLGLFTILLIYSVAGSGRIRNT